jgi:hypothetical protein
MSTPTFRTTTELLNEADHILRTTNFDRSTEARVDKILRLAELSRAGEFHNPTQIGSARYSIADRANQAARLYQDATIDGATLAFFRGHRGCGLREERKISVSGGMIEERSSVTHLGRPMGAITELRDFSSIMDPERRTYSGLTTAMGGVDGGNTVPIGFIAQVFQAMKRTDQVLEAANWDTAATVDGRPTNLPSLTDTSTSALKVSDFPESQRVCEPGVAVSDHMVKPSHQGKRSTRPRRRRETVISAGRRVPDSLCPRIRRRCGSYADQQCGHGCDYRQSYSHNPEGPSRTGQKC